MAIETLLGAIPPLTPTGTPDGASAAAPGFDSTLDRVVASVEQTNTAANAAVGRMAAGEGDVHDAMIALQRAELTLQLAVQVRNKLVQAYQDIMRMPV
jgi:flagellar hook-basal body complex protein FliE